MNRSQINQAVTSAKAFFSKFQFTLPPFAYWDLTTWHQNKNQAKHPISAGLGWDVTDHGFGDFEKSGLVLFTLRNGHPTDLNEGYAEKLMMAQENQIVPYHFHKQKTEDIINRGGGVLKIALAESTEDGQLSSEPCTVYIDGMAQRVASQSIVSLRPGSSIHIPPYLYHRFWAENGSVLIGEVSTINDDQIDNYFLEEVGRFPKVTEDEPIQHLLVSDYANILR